MGCDSTKSAIKHNIWWPHSIRVFLWVGKVLVNLGIWSNHGLARIASCGSIESTVEHDLW